ncbi:MAG: zinc ribbon domain-containing protein [Chloroflexi bacterium]|nr:zinc ribbon domain-containing protein [Chloroflexota bacterium]
MPCYEYTCRECRHTHERLRSAAQREAPATCPRCGAPATVRLSLVAWQPGGAGSIALSATAASGGCCGGACGCHAGGRHD